jgi:D-alanyl-D-alanine carboxypeptidase
MQYSGIFVAIISGLSGLVSTTALAADPSIDAATETIDVVDLCGEDGLALTTETDTLPTEQAAKLDALLVQMITAEGAEALEVQPAPGLALRVETPDGIYAKAVGVADVETCEPLQPNALFQIGSNTKMMTAMIIFQLQEEGVLSIDDSLSRWLPEITEQLPYGDEISIAQLLTHTSGLWDYVDGTPGQQNGLFWEGLNNPDLFAQDFTPAELIDYAVENGTPNYEPGTPGPFWEATGGWQYTNTGYILLGMIIEKATGQSLRDNYIFRVWNIAGMSSTYLQESVPDDGELALLPTGYLEPPFDKDTTGFNMSQAWAAGAVLSTAEDMARFVRHLFDGDYYIQPETLAQMLTPAPNTTGWTDDFFYGDGVFIKGGFFGHGGQSLAFESDIAYDPEHDVVVVIWGNSSTNFAGQGASQVAELLGY